MPQKFLDRHRGFHYRSVVMNNTFCVVCPWQLKHVEHVLIVHQENPSPNRRTPDKVPLLPFRAHKTN